MVGGRVLVPLLTAGVLAVLPPRGSAIPRLALHAIKHDGDGDVEQDVLKRPLKVFTLYDRHFSRIAKVWRDCLTKAMPRPLAHMSVEAKELSSRGMALLQTGARLPSEKFSNLLMNEWAAKLAVADTLHIDADAFLLKDPARATTVRYPEADIVAVADCVHSGERCAWYRRRDYLARHRGQDPLKAQGFMLNTGFMYLRSSPATMHLMNHSIKLTHAGENEQVALNEVLLAKGCTWMTADGSPAPEGREAAKFLETGTLHGLCKPAIGSKPPESRLHVVVLPSGVVPREMMEDSFGNGVVEPQSVAYHPGGRVEEKERILGRVRRLCRS